MTDDPFPDDFSDLDRWANEYKPEADGRMPGPELLPDSSYEFEIVAATMRKTQKKQDTIFALHLRVRGGAQDGAELERVTWFNRQEDVNRLGGDMVTLGLVDAKDWGKRNKPWSQELRDACPRLKGLRFRGSKTSSEGDKKTFHNLFVNALLKPAQAPTGAAASAPLPAATTAANDDPGW